MKKDKSKLSCLKVTALTFLISSSFANANIHLEEQVKVSDIGLFFDGEKVANNAENTGPGQYDYLFGQQISAHGDAIKVYKDYVFVTWYRGGKYNRHVMLSRYNRATGKVKSIEFPHTHTGFQNQWWIGESHNTIAVAISPVDESIHLLYDMHAYSNSKPSDGSLSQDYFRYSFSMNNAASVPDSEFNLSLFEQNDDGGYKHLTLTGEVDHDTFSGLTYPKFFQNTLGELLVYMRKGGNNNGGYQFAKYKADENRWSDFQPFNVINAKSYGEEYNWGVYGSMKFVDGKLRVGFQRRSGNNNDKYVYQNGFYYAYSDDPSGATQWKDHRGNAFSIPLAESDKIKISEPGDLVSQTAPNSVYIVHGFDWTVSDAGDVHFIGAVKTTDNSERVKVHTYKKSGDEDFTTTTDFAGADKIYTSGNRIYIIGLNSQGRPFIEMAKSGTNDFTRVYEAKDGPNFRHGVVHVENDKVYYYLQERGESDKLPLYVQIIDLELDPTAPEGFEFASVENQPIRIDTPVDIAFGSNGEFVYLYGQESEINCNVEQLGDPNPGQTNYCYTRPAQSLEPVVTFEQTSVELNEGYDSLYVLVNASTNKPDSTISTVKLYLNDEFLRQEKYAPYEWGDNERTELLGLKAGTHTIAAIAVDSDGIETETAINVTVSTLEPQVIYVDDEQAPNLASNMLDGDNSDTSRWSAQDFSKAVIFDLGRTETITGTSMWTYQNRAYQYQVSVSDQPSGPFTLLSDMGDNTSSAQPLTTHDQAQGRYVKLNVIGASNYNHNWVSINEFKINTQ
ncbi:BNR-4 repeat-containing protein [Vibrio sp. 10N.222.54.C3]|uniref:BNR-4 repeat-containing protein n=1 Tax=unclassified Vibrio TaxID=2614977 RepID=UPI0035509331